VLEQAAYTVTLQLTHVFTEVGTPAAREAMLSTYPDVRLRVYCDARLVQAQDWAEGQSAAVALQGRAAMDRELHQRWARNIMLNKWLEYSLDRGHCFA
jgi:uncharacterized protein YqiB (DUF1249 family)